MRFSLISLFSLVIALIGCAQESAPTEGDDGLGIVWGAVSSGGECVSPLINGQGLPAESEPLHVDRLLVRLEDLNLNGSLKTRQRSFETSAVSFSDDNFLIVDQVMADTDFNLRLVGCREGDPKPVWTGYKPAVVVPEFSKISPSVFITSENELSCASQDVEVGNRIIGSDQPTGNAAFATLIPTKQGDFLVAGGAAPSGSALGVEQSLSLYHTQTGTFFSLEGQLGTARAMATGTLVDGANPKSLIIGGSPTLSPSANTAEPYLSPGSKGSDFAASEFIEAIDPSNGESSAWKVPPGLDGDGQRMPAMASILYDSESDTLFVAGGYGPADAGAPQLLAADNAFVVRELKTLVGTEEGPAKNAAVVSLQHPRIGPAILKAPGGDVIVYGGNPDGVAENLAEWISSDGLSSSMVAVDSPTELPAVSFAATYQLASGETQTKHLIVGGIPAQLDQFPSSAIVSGGFAAIVTIDSGSPAPSVSVEELDLGDHSQRVFGAAFRIGANQFGLAGGLAAITKTSDFPETLCVDDIENQCTRNTISVFTYENNKVAAETVDGASLGASIGTTAATLPGGSLLFTAGLHSLEDDSSTENRRPLIWNPLLATEAKLCPVENCGDLEGRDEDLDGLVNCEDPECADQRACGGSRD